MLYEVITVFDQNRLVVGDDPEGDATWFQGDFRLGVKFGGGAACCPDPQVAGFLVMHEDVADLSLERLGCLLAQGFEQFAVV